uniref:Uncharacterized protein n=1 Tax=Sphaerodactylus townsendi TaxID=933632 RepID=A0ACB8EBD5_9SAUR
MNILNHQIEVWAFLGPDDVEKIHLGTSDPGPAHLDSDLSFLAKHINRHRETGMCSPVGPSFEPEEMPPHLCKPPLSRDAAAPSPDPAPVGLDDAHMPLRLAPAGTVVRRSRG